MTIVLLPGMDGTGLMFSPFIEYLPKEWNVVVARYPESEALGYLQLAKLASELIPGSGDYVLVGESFSGPIAVSLAATADERLKALILCCSFVRSPIEYGALGVRYLSFLPLSSFPFSPIEYWLFGRFRTEAGSSLLRSALDRVSHSVLGYRIREVLSVDVSAELEKVKAPILYLRATEDHLVPEKSSLEVANFARNFALVDLAGPHCLLQACPNQAAAAVHEFMVENGAENRL